MVCFHATKNIRNPTNQTNNTNMNFKALLSIFSILISSISALSVLEFPLNLRVEPGKELSLKLEGSEIAAGEHVRVELWDHQDDEDVNAAIIGDEIAIKSDNSISFDIPAHFPKTKNAFFRIYYKSHNTVTPRFSIKHPKNCLNNKTATKPTVHQTAVVIYQPAASTPTPVVIQSSHVAPIVATATLALSAIEQALTSIVDAATTTSASVFTSATTATSVSTMSSSTSTSSAAVTKVSAGSIAIALAVAFALLF